MSTVVFKKKKVKTLALSKKRSRKAEGKDGASSESEHDLVLGKAKKTTQGIDITSAKLKPKEDIALTYSGDRTAASNNTNDATRETADIDGYGEAALLGRYSQAATQKVENLAVNESHNITVEKALAPARKVGPVKAPSNVRAISVIDYQPDVCKDYKQTGFCGFGDTCKFLHDRGDFKQGWQLDRDWEDVGTTKKSTGSQIAKQDYESTIPFACIICKSNYKNPIITRCGHYFCEKCALQRYKKTPACAQCGSGTGGLFSGAKQLEALLAAKQQRIELENSAEENRSLVE